MKSLISNIKLLTTVFAVLISFSAFAQRTITGTVYKDGEVAAGVTVEGHKSKETFMTSFDGKYSINVGDGAKWLRFTFIDESEKVDIEGNTSDVIDFSFDGVIPEATVDASGADLRSAEELQRAGETDFLSPYTMYDQFYDQDDYDGALPYWRTLYNKYPASSKNIYISGEKMYKDKIEKASTPQIREQYIDTLMAVYDKRVEHFGQKGYVLSRKAVALLEYKITNGPELSDEERISVFKEAYNYLDESISEEGENAEPAAIVLYMQTTRSLYMMGELANEKVAENYNLLSEIVDANLAKGGDEEKYTTTKESIDSSFQTSGAADCETLVSLYTPKFDQISQDIDQLKKMLQILGKQRCTDSDLYANASEALYEMEPSAEAAFNMARLYVKRNEIDRAKEFYQDAIDAETDKELLSTYYYELGAFTLSEKSYQQARNYANQAIANDPTNGNAYMLKGNVYAQYAPNYGSTDFEKKVLYWLATDYFQKAKNVDPDTFQAANSQIKTYSAYFPGTETMFMAGVTKGDSYKIEGWINETTTAR